MSKWSSAFRDSRWQKKRLQVMERDKWTCRSCGERGEGITLNVHHIFYEKGRAPWEYDDDMLVTWCEDCHTSRHKLQKCILKSMANVGICSLTNIMPILDDPELIMALGNMNATPETIKSLVNIVNRLANDSYIQGYEDSEE